MQMVVSPIYLLMTGAPVSFRAACGWLTIWQGIKSGCLWQKNTQKPSILWNIWSGITMSALWSGAVISTVTEWQTRKNIKMSLWKQPDHCLPVSVREQALFSHGMPIKAGREHADGNVRWLSIIWWIWNCCLKLRLFPVTLPFTI